MMSQQEILAQATPKFCHSEIHHDSQEPSLHPLHAGSTTPGTPASHMELLPWNCHCSQGAQNVPGFAG